MLPGPVFTFDLMATARRGRFYLARALYAAVLFVILWNVQLAWLSETRGELSHKLVNWFAFSAFCGIAIGQELLVLALTPALVAGVIADEKKAQDLALPARQPVDQRRDRRGQAVGTDALRGGPSGCQPAGVESAGVAGWNRSAVGFVGLRGDAQYGVVPGVAFDLGIDDRAAAARSAVHRFWPGVPLAVLSADDANRLIVAVASVLRRGEWLSEWAGASSPVEVVWRLFWARFRGGAFKAVGCGTHYLDDRHASEFRACFCDPGGLATASDLSTPECGRVGSRSSRAPIDLEVSAAQATAGPGRSPHALEGAAYRRSTRVHLVLGFLLTVIGGGFLAYYTVWIGAMASAEWWVHGYGLQFGNFRYARDNFRFFIKLVVPLLYLAGILKVAGMAAGAITSEHEEDTWVSMTSTVLTGREIIFAKLVGALGRGRQLAEVIIVLAVAGVVLGVLARAQHSGLNGGVKYLRLVRRRARALGFAPVPLDLASPVFDSRLPAPDQHHGPSGAQLRHPVRFHPPALAGLHSS